MNVVWMNTAQHLLVNAEPSCQMDQSASQTGSAWITAAVESAACVRRMVIVKENNTVLTNTSLPLRMSALATVIVIVFLAPNVEVTVQLVPGLLHVRKTNIFMVHPQTSLVIMGQTPWWYFWQHTSGRPMLLLHWEWFDQVVKGIHKHQYLSAPSHNCREFQALQGSNPGFLH